MWFRALLRCEESMYEYLNQNSAESSSSSSSSKPFPGQCKTEAQIPSQMNSSNHAKVENWYQTLITTRVILEPNLPKDDHDQLIVRNWWIVRVHKPHLLQMDHFVSSQIKIILQPGCQVSIWTRSGLEYFTNLAFPWNKGVHRGPIFLPKSYLLGWGLVRSLLNQPFRVLLDFKENQWNLSPLRIMVRRSVSEISSTGMSMVFGNWIITPV